MSSIQSASIIACICCIACSFISLVVPFGRMRKTVNLVLGLFVLCSMLIPIIGAFSTEKITFDIDESTYTCSDYSTEYEKDVLNKTADNLVVAANNLLSQENINVDNIAVGIKKSASGSIYISRINIYINKSLESDVDKIKSIISINMSKEPVVIVSES